MELTESAVHPQETSSLTTPVRVKLAFAPDPTHDYTDLLRNIIDRAFASSASGPIEIIVVDPADSEQTTSEKVPFDLPASRIASPTSGRQTSGRKARWTTIQRLAPGLVP